MLPFILLYEADLFAILPLLPLYEPDSAIILACYEADPAAILLLAASITSGIPDRGLAVYRSAAQYGQPLAGLSNV